MKRFIYLIASSALALGLLNACTPKEEPVAADNITITGNNLVIPAAGGEAWVAVEATGSFNVSIDKEWCTYTVSNGDTVKFMAASNESLEPRYSKARLTVGKKSVEVTVQQFGFLSSSFNPVDIISPSAASVYKFPYSYPEEMTASTAEDWIHLTVKADTLIVALDENTKQGTLDDRYRMGEVSWKLGVDSGIIDVAQSNISFMQEDGNWDVHYAGSGIDETFQEPVDYIRNDVTDPAISGKYAISYVTKSEVEESGLPLADYVADVVAPQIKSNFDLIIMISQIFGLQMTYDDLLYEESHDEVFDPFEKGDYYALAVGFDSDCELTGHYQYSEFSIRGGGDRPEKGYASWLGDWTVTRGSYTDTWTITKNVEGESYFISGIEGDPCNVGNLEAEYDSENDALVLKAAVDIKTVSTSYGDASVGLYGMILHSDGKEYFITPGGSPYVIFTATHSSYEVANLTPGTVKLSDGGTYDLIKFAFFGNLLDGSGAVSFSQDKTPLPTTITSAGGGGGEGGAYEDWLGTWTDPDGGVYTVSRKVADQTFNITGFDVNGGLVAEAQFDPATGQMLLCGQDMGADSEFSYILAGIDSEDYVEMGDSNNGYLLATGSVSSDGKTARFTGNEYDATYGGVDYHEVIVSVELFGIDSADDIYSFKGNPTLNMGATLTKQNTTANFTKIANRMLSRISPDPVQRKEIRRPDLKGYPCSSMKAK